jgi:small-conductance mechanosensitive channel
MALAWIGIALIPYSFLTYSRQIPSRQTYLASFGLALLVGLAMAHLAAGRRAAGKLPRAVAVVATVVLLGNVGYLWTRKRAQFLARAEPTEQLIRLARQTDGPIWVQCFPRVPYIAQEAVHLAAGRPPSTLIWSQAEAERRKPAAVFCYQER